MLQTAEKTSNRHKIYNCVWISMTSGEPILFLSSFYFLLSTSVFINSLNFHKVKPSDNMNLTIELHRLDRVSFERCRYQSYRENMKESCLFMKEEFFVTFFNWPPLSLCFLPNTLGWMIFVSQRKAFTNITFNRFEITYTQLPELE